MHETLKRVFRVSRSVPGQKDVAAHCSDWEAARHEQQSDSTQIRAADARSRRSPQFLLPVQSISTDHQVSASREF